MKVWNEEELKKCIGREFRFVYGPPINDHDICTLHGIKKDNGCLILEDANGEIVVKFIESFNGYELLPIIPEGFMRWFGGECPVANHVAVEVVTAYGVVTKGFADEYSWGGITGYRIIEEPTKPKEINLTGYWHVVWGTLEYLTVGSAHIADREVAIGEAKAMKHTTGCEYVGIKVYGSPVVELV